MSAQLQSAGIFTPPCSSGRPSSIGGRGCAAAAALDQERDNRFDGHGPHWFDSIAAGEVMLTPSRSGGAFDPLGCRSVDCARRDDLIAVVDTLGGGRWYMITLTIDRTAWTNPETAYPRCQERVRKCMAEGFPSGVWFASLEVQTKSGDGWPHWHALGWVSSTDTRTHEQVRADVLKRWTIRTEHVDSQSGEVSYSIEPIGRPRAQQVEPARDRFGAGRYISKYITKAWQAVPDFLLYSRRRRRKFRLSNGFYDVLERMNRHVRHRGARKERTGTGRQSRMMIDRMASSGSTMVGYQWDGERFTWVGTIKEPITILGEWSNAGRVRLCAAGSWSKMRAAVSVHRFRTLQARAKFVDSGRTAAYEEEQRLLLSVQWERMQEESPMEEGRDDLDVSGVGDDGLTSDEERAEGIRVVHWHGEEVEVCEPLCDGDDDEDDGDDEED